MLAGGEGPRAVPGENGVHDGLMPAQFDDIIAGNGAKVVLVNRAEQIGERGKKRVAADVINMAVKIRVNAYPALAIKMLMKQAHLCHQCTQPLPFGVVGV